MPERVVGCGGYGTVVRYAGDDDRDYVVKVEKVDPSLAWSTEHATIRALADVACGQILARVIGVGPYHFGRRTGAFSLLENMDGDLIDGGAALLADYRTYNGLLSAAEAAVHMVDQVRRQIVCLLNNDNTHVFTDLKRSNVLFRRVPDTGEVTIKVGDLGGMTPDDYGDYVFTFPCLPSGEPWQSFASLDEKRACLAYQLGLLLASLLRLSISPYVYDKKLGPKTSTAPLRRKLRRALAPRRCAPWRTSCTRTPRNGRALPFLSSDKKEDPRNAEPSRVWFIWFISRSVAF